MVGQNDGLCALRQQERNLEDMVAGGRAREERTRIHGPVHGCCSDLAQEEMNRKGNKRAIKGNE